MCRIWGVSYNTEAEDIDNRTIAAVMFRRLVSGGPHSYGWMTSDGDTFDTHKFVGRADSLYAAQDFVDFMAPQANFVVGHTRYATHGAPSYLANNHPITHGNIVGVHNGILDNHEAILARTGREDPKAEVDSEAIFAAVNRWGHAQGLRRVQGNLVAVYGDVRKPNLLYIARSYGRELHMAWSDKGNLFFASEEQALRALMPEINLSRFTTVSAFRHLTIRNGSVITRQTYDEPARKALAAKAKQTKQWAPKWDNKQNKSKSKGKAKSNTTRGDSYGRIAAELRQANSGVSNFEANMEKYREEQKRRRNAKIREADAESRRNVEAGLTPKTVLRDPDAEQFDLIEWQGGVWTEEEIRWMTSE